MKVNVRRLSPTGFTLFLIFSAGCGAESGDDSSPGDMVSTSGGSGSTFGSGGSGSPTSGGADGSGGGLSTGGGTFGSGGASSGGTFSEPLGDPPLLVTSGLFDQGDEDDLGLSAAPGTQTVTIFAPSTGPDKYNNGVVMVGFQGYLYAQWQSSPLNEDTDDTRVLISRSSNVTTWSTPVALATPEDGAIRTSGGFWVNGSTLVAYLNVWPEDADPRGGYVEYVTSTDGLNWSDPEPVLMQDGEPFEGIFEQDPHALPDGRIVNAAHFQPGLKVGPCFTDDPSGVAGWERATFSSLDATGDQTRELEPSWYLRSDGNLVMTFRDQAGTYKKLASMSDDWGLTWSTPVETNMPDSRSKQSAGNLPDGTAFLVGNPVDENRRVPLVVTLSDDGQTFDRAYLLRGGDDLQAQRTSGQAKTLGYNYPKSMVYEGYLYAAYATNKEDVEFTRVPLASLSP